MTPNQKDAIAEAKNWDGEFPVIATAHNRRRTALSLVRHGLFELAPGGGRWGEVYRLTPEGWAL